MKQKVNREEGCEEGQGRSEVQRKMGEDKEEQEERMGGGGMERGGPVEGGEEQRAEKRGWRARVLSEDGTFSIHVLH